MAQIHLTDVRLEIPDEVLKDKPWLRNRMIEMLGNGFIDQFESCFGNCNVSVEVRDGKNFHKTGCG